jgi:hypothetical protein
MALIAGRFMFYRTLGDLRLLAVIIFIYLLTLPALLVIT